MLLALPQPNPPKQGSARAYIPWLCCPPKILAKNLARVPTSSQGAPQSQPDPLPCPCSLYLQRYSLSVQLLNNQIRDMPCHAMRYDIKTADMSRTMEVGARAELEDQEGCPLPATDAALSLRSYLFNLRTSETVGSDENVVISAFHLYFWSVVTVTHCFLGGEKKKLFRECNVFRAWYQRESQL